MKEYERKSLNIIKALSNGVRYRIIKILHKEKKLTVGEICKRIKRGSGRTSSHLKILRDADLVWFYTKGKVVFYSLKHKKIIDVIMLIEGMVKRK